jgi:hypothetical protein
VQCVSVDKGPWSKEQKFMTQAQTRVPRLGTKMHGTEKPT